MALKRTYYLKPFVLFILLQFLFSAGTTQVLPAARSTDWSSAGLSSPQVYPLTKINMLDLGADPSGQVSCQAAFIAAQAQLNGKAGVIYFPNGTYRFEETLELADSQIIRGNGADSTSLAFDLGGSGNLINASGSIQSTAHALVQVGIVGDSTLVVTNGASWQPGDLAKLYKDDMDLVTDTWAYNTVAQIVRIIAREGDTITLDQVLRTDFPLDRHPALKKITRRHQAGIECLKIVRLDPTTGQSKNIFFKYAADCWVSGVESDACNFGHVVIESSSHVEVKGSYFHHAFDYGGGGKAYGVVLQLGANLCLVENNVFEHLRHAMLLQAGANGNVLAYNYSTDPFWSSFPANGAGDLVCHGNYPFLNLFDHNIVQNLIIDNAHGPNGPYNTFFRNRAELYGIIMTATNSPNQNFIGNEITNAGFLLGNYSLMGTGHFEYGNNHLGTIKPIGTDDVTDGSYYYTGIPDFLAVPWPRIGPPQVLNGYSIPARDRYVAGMHITVCPDGCNQAYRDWKVWTGCAGTTHWFDPANWEDASLPSPSDPVCIPYLPAGGNTYPILTGDATIQSLWIQKGAKLEVMQGVVFTVLEE